MLLSVGTPPRCTCCYNERMRPTPPDLRRRIVAARFEDGQSLGQIAERFRIPKGTVQSVLKRYQDAGTLEPKPNKAGRKRALTPKQELRLDRYVQRHPGATLAELRKRSGADVSLATIHNTLKRLGFTREEGLYVRGTSGGTD